MKSQVVLAQVVPWSVSPSQTNHSNDACFDRHHYHFHHFDEEDGLDNDNFHRYLKIEAVNVGKKMI